MVQIKVGDSLRLDGKVYSVIKFNTTRSAPYRLECADGSRLWSDLSTPYELLTVQAEPKSETAVDSEPVEKVQVEDEHSVEKPLKKEKSKKEDKSTKPEKASPRDSENNDAENKSEEVPEGKSTKVAKVNPSHDPEFPNNGLPWTKEDDEALLAFGRRHGAVIGQAIPWDRLAGVLHRRPETLRQRHKKIKDPVKRQKDQQRKGSSRAQREIKALIEAMGLTDEKVKAFEEAGGKPVQISKSSLKKLAKKAAKKRREEKALQEAQEEKDKLKREERERRTEKYKQAAKRVAEKEKKKNLEEAIKSKQEWKETKENLKVQKKIDRKKRQEEKVQEMNIDELKVYERRVRIAKEKRAKREEEAALEAAKVSAKRSREEEGDASPAKKAKEA